MSADRQHPRDFIRDAARRGVVPQEEPDRTDTATRASDAVRAAFHRQRARTLLPADDAGKGT